jgi:hypothetical protein
MSARFDTVQISRNFAGVETRGLGGPRSFPFGQHALKLRLIVARISFSVCAVTCVPLSFILYIGKALWTQPRFARFAESRWSPARRKDSARNA